MFELVSKHKRLIMVVLCVLIIPPFAFFGIDFYFRDSSAGSGIASVGKTRISEQEFGMALRQAQDRMRDAVRENPQLAAQLDSPEFKEAVLEDLIQRRVMLAQAAGAGMAVSDTELQTIIAGIEAFRDENGKFSPERYQRLLRAQGMTPLMFENQLRQDVLLSRLQSVYAGTAFVPDAVVEYLVRLREQQREVSQALFEPSRYRDQAKVTEAEAKKYYEEHSAEFRVPERVKLEYVVLTPEAAARSVTVSEEELHQAYQSRLSQFQTPEKRSASHILFAAGSSATEEEKAKARAQAEDVLSQLRASPSRFAELARKFSQDPGSAEQGGALGEFERGFMVKPFDDAVFSMKPGEIRGPVETQYGYHIIRLDGVKPTVTTPFDKVRAQLLEEVRKERMQRAFTEAAQRFGDMVYEQYESLQPVAEAFKLTIQKTDWIGKSGANANALFNNPRLLEQVFSQETIANRRNTEAIEVQSNQLVSARVVEHAPESTLPFEQVKADILEHLRDRRAAERAEKEGRDVLEKLQKGQPVDVRWSAPVTVTLQRPQGLHPEGMRAVFGADASKLPAYVGVAASDGRFVIYRVSKVQDVQSVNPDQIKAAGNQIAQLAAQQQFAALVASMREGAKIRIDKSKLQPPPR
jgi:peptidyl-prolyl cis-trans isomerase D